LTIGLDQEAKYLRTIDVQGADYTEKVGTEVDKSRSSTCYKNTLAPSEYRYKECGWRDGDRLNRNRLTEGRK
jgi:hypothetical protein